MIAFRKTHGGANCRGFSAGGGGPGSPGDNRILSNDHCSAPFSRAIFGWFGTAKVYSGTGADIVNGINYTSCQLPWWEQLGKGLGGLQELGTGRISALPRRLEG